MAKKRANGEGSIRRKPNGRWEGRYTQGIDPSTGRAIQKSVSARTQAECKEKLAKAIRDNRGIPVNHNEDYTVAEWCRLWFETYSKPVIRPNTAKTYENMIENHIVPAVGGVKLKRLTAIQIQKMYNDSKTKGRVQRFEKKTDTTLSGSTVRRIHMVLSSALKQAVKERIIPYNPCDNCRIPPKEKKEMTIIPPEKLGVYLSEAEKYGVLPMFFLELSSGLRRGELLALRWDDLNVKDRILSVSKQVTRIDGELVVTEPKTKNSVQNQPEAAGKGRHRGACALPRSAPHLRHHGPLQRRGCENAVQYAGPLQCWVHSRHLYAHYHRYAERCGRENRRLHGNGHGQAGTGTA